MSFDNIPYKNCPTKGLPDELLTKIKEYESKVENETNTKINNLLVQKQTELDNFHKEVDYTYRMLSAGLNYDKYYRVEVKGTIKDRYEKPTIKLWSDDNYGKYLVIKYFMEEFEKRGWKPTLKLSDFKYEIDNFMDTPAEYVGGNIAILECHFD